MLRFSFIDIKVSCVDLHRLENHLAIESTGNFMEYILKSALPQNSESSYKVYPSLLQCL